MGGLERLFRGDWVWSFRVRRAVPVGIVARVARALLPSRCLLCDAAAGACLNLCDPCRAELPVVGHGCDRCGVPLAVPATCGRCLQRHPRFDVATAPLIYDGAARQLLTRFKFDGDLAAARALTWILRRHVEHRGPVEVEALTPVPLHRSRLAARGFNQAVEIARLLGRPLGLPVFSRAVARPLSGPPQSRLGDRSARRRNVRGAFVVKRGLGVRAVAIVDDVITTGATVDEMAASLRRAGVERVEVWALARTPRDGQY